jgi:Tfp pilus assembly protein PilO
MKTTTPFIFILVAIGLFYTVAMPHYEKVKALQAEADQYANVLDNVDELAEKRDALLLEYNKIPKVEVVRIEKALPDNIDSVRLALDFDSIAAKYGIAIKSIKTGDNRPAVDGAMDLYAASTLYQSAPVTISFVATYDNFRKFMKDIESSLRVIDIKTVTFLASETNLYEYTVSLDTYWLK